MFGWHCILLQENHHTVYLSVCKIIFFFPTVKMDYGGSNLKSNHKIYGLLLLRHGVEIHTLSAYCHIQVTRAVMSWTVPAGMESSL